MGDPRTFLIIFYYKKSVQGTIKIKIKIRCTIFSLLCLFILLYSLDSPRKLPHAYILSCPLRQIQQMAIVRLAKRAHLLHDVADVVNSSHDLSIP